VDADCLSCGQSRNPSLICPEFDTHVKCIGRNISLGIATVPYNQIRKLLCEEHERVIFVNMYFICALRIHLSLIQYPDCLDVSCRLRTFFPTNFWFNILHLYCADREDECCIILKRTLSIYVNLFLWVESKGFWRWCITLCCMLWLELSSDWSSGRPYVSVGWIIAARSFA
jgi:hypothetical protein